MKQVYLILTMLLISLTASAQFILTQEGLATKNNKPYVVVKSKGTKAELFDKVRLRLLTLKNQPIRRHVSFSEPDIIVLNGTFNEFNIAIGNMRAMLNPIINFKMNIYFKDNRVRFDLPEIEDLVKDRDSNYTSYALTSNAKGKHEYGVFKDDGEVRYEDLKKAIEDSFNNLIIAIMYDLDKVSLPEDW